MAIEVIIGAVANIVAIVIAAWALWYNRKDKSEDEKNINTDRDFLLDKRVTVLESNMITQNQKIQDTQKDIKEVKDGFYREVKEIKEDVRMILKLIIENPKK